MRPFFFSCLFIWASAGIAQDSTSSFRISDYKYRTPGFKAFSLQTYLGGQITKNGIVDSLHYTGRNFHLAPTNLNFYRTFSTDKRLHESVFSLSANGGASRFTFQGEKSSNTTLSGSFNWTRKDQYFHRKNWFWELGNSLNLAGNRNSSESKSLEEKASYSYIQDNLILGMGKGRIENVQDAQMALFIINDLEKEGLLINSGEVAIYELAQLITEINNTRVFDFRKRRIFELQKIDSFLQEKGLTGKTDIRHFALVNDNWIFANAPFRRHGSQFFLRLLPGIYFYQQQSRTNHLVKSTLTKNNRALSLSPEIGYESYKAKSLKWQRNFEASFSYRKSFHEDSHKTVFDGIVFDEGRLDYESYQAQLSANYSIGYFPNTRTYISGGIGGTVIQNNLLFSGNDGLTFISSFHINTSYFLGYRTRLTAGIGASHRMEDKQFPGDKKYRPYEFSTQFNMGINHFIF